MSFPSCIFLLHKIYIIPDSLGIKCIYIYIHHQIKQYGQVSILSESSIVKDHFGEDPLTEDLRFPRRAFSPPAALVLSALDPNQTLFTFPWFRLTCRCPEAKGRQCLVTQRGGQEPLWTLIMDFSLLPPWC